MHAHGVTRASWWDPGPRSAQSAWQSSALSIHTNMNPGPVDHDAVLAVDSTGQVWLDREETGDSYVCIAYILAVECKYVWCDPELLDVV